MARVGRRADADGPGSDRVKGFDSGGACEQGALCRQAQDAELGRRKRSRASFFNR